jgi:hypothetical protein
MTFILSDNRGSPQAVDRSFADYREYLKLHAATFPPGAHALATSDWYYNPKDHRCPHDAWLESTTLTEPASGVRSEIRQTALTVRLLGAYHDGIIELHYPRVFKYALTLNDVTDGHRDWLWDEFRVSADGHLIHEIEWAGQAKVGHWLIEAADVTLTWHPRESA